MRVFVAGALGVIGRPLTVLLMRAGHEVVGTTRSRSRVFELQQLGATPVVMDALDADAVMAAVAASDAEILIHQLTDLPKVYVPEEVTAARERNARLRLIGTRNLMAAARAESIGRVIAQSIAFVYAPGPHPYKEESPLHYAAEGSDKVAVQGVIDLESAVLHTPGVEGVVLRYGRLYGAGTWFEVPPQPPKVSPDAAAHAALLAMTRGAPGIYNIAEDDGTVSIARARRELGFDPSFRIGA